MSHIRPLTEIKRRSVDEVVGLLLDKDPDVSASAGRRLLREAAQFGLDVRDYLTLAVQGHDGLNGYEAALMKLNLPIRNDFDNGIVLQAASDTFQTYPGTRAMFPEVIDDVLRWASRQVSFENTASIVANTRTITGTELISTVIGETDDKAQGRYDTFTVPEGARIPVRTIRTEETSVKIWKHGSALRTTYEFNRRASIDILVPHANRIARELETSKVTAAINVLINGDGVHSAASTVAQSAYNSNTGVNATAGTLSWQHFLYWLVMRAKAGAPVDTVIGNWDMAFKWAKMWSVSGSDTKADAENFQAMTNQLTMGGLRVPLPTFALASAMPANKLLGITKGETLEELVEAGSNIEESERSIINQTMTYTKTENTGYKLAYGDTREIFDIAA